MLGIAVFQRVRVQHELSQSAMQAGDSLMILKTKWSLKMVMVKRGKRLEVAIELTNIINFLTKTN